MAEEKTQDSPSPLPKMFTPDEPEVIDEPVDAVLDNAADVEATDEPDEGAEVEDEGKPTEDAKPQGRDKALQQMQQWRTTFERQTQERFDGLQGKLVELLDTIKAQGGKATAEQKEEVQEAKDELDELLEGLEQTDDDEILTAAQAKAAFKAINAKLTKARAADDSDTVKQLKQELQAIKDQQAQVDFTRTWEADFNEKNPEISGQGLKLVSQARKTASERHPNFKGEMLEGAAAIIFDELVKQAKTSKTPAKLPPVAAKPTKSTSGTQTVASGASATRPAGTTRGATSKPPMYVPD